jgi:tyrosine-protein phosphatase SIW14
LIQSSRGYQEMNRGTSCIISVVSSILIIDGVGSAGQRPADWAQPVTDLRIRNFYKVSNDVYRSAQPNVEAIKQLERFGIRSMLNLRERHTDACDARGTKIRLYQVPIDPARINDEVIARALKVIAHADKPILVHCWHGSDRTGAVIAMYRMVFMNWPREKAIDEFQNGGFGYHRVVYPNIIKYLASADIEKLKKEAASSTKQKNFAPGAGTKFFCHSALKIGFVIPCAELKAPAHVAAPQAYTEASLRSVFISLWSEISAPPSGPPDPASLQSRRCVHLHP